MKTLDTRKPLTVTHVSRILAVDSATVRKWVAEKSLKAFTLPGGSHYRVKHSDLRAFLKRNKMPTDRLDAFEEKGWSAIEDAEPESD